MINTKKLKFISECGSGSESRYGSLSGYWSRSGSGSGYRSWSMSWSRSWSGYWSMPRSVSGKM